MQKRYSLGVLVGTVSALIAASALGCGGGGSICDVDFGSIAGAYSFTLTTHNSRFQNSCFENFNDPGPTDPANMTDCTWTEEADEETVTIEMEITENGDVGSAQIIDVKGEDAEVEALGVNCEMLAGELCDAPVRCTITGQECDFAGGSPDDWMYSCNCATGSDHDPEGAACQACKSAFETYESERNEKCEKSAAGDYIEFTLHVRS